VGADKTGTLCHSTVPTTEQKKGERKERKNSRKGLLPSPYPPLTKKYYNYN
jgi:hypothetical protein